MGFATAVKMKKTFAREPRLLRSTRVLAWVTNRRVLRRDQGKEWFATGNILKERAEGFPTASLKNTWIKMLQRCKRVKILRRIWADPAVYRYPEIVQNKSEVNVRGILFRILPIFPNSYQNRRTKIAPAPTLFLNNIWMWWIFQELSVLLSRLCRLLRHARRCHLPAASRKFMFGSSPISCVRSQFLVCSWWKRARRRLAGEKKMIRKRLGAWI